MRHDNSDDELGLPSPEPSAPGPRRGRSRRVVLRVQGRARDECRRRARLEQCRSRGADRVERGAGTDGQRVGRTHPRGQCGGGAAQFRHRGCAADAPQGQRGQQRRRDRGAGVGPAGAADDDRGDEAVPRQGDAERAAAWERLGSGSSRFRRAERTFSVVWGVALLGECVARIVGVYVLPVDTMVWLGTLVLAGAMVVAVLVGGALAVDPMKGMLRDEVARCRDRGSDAVTAGSGAGSSTKCAEAVAQCA